MLDLQSCGAQPFWYQGLISWETLFPWIGGEGVVLGWFKCITFIVRFFWSVAKLCLTLCNTIDYSMPGFPVLHYLLEFAQPHVHWVNDAIQPSHPLSSPSPALKSKDPSISVFSNESFLRIRWTKDWSFSFSISPSNEYSRPISFRIDWLDLAVQGTLKSLLQKERKKVFSKTTVQKHQFFGTQLSL